MFKNEGKDSSNAPSGATEAPSDGVDVSAVASDGSGDDAKALEAIERALGEGGGASASSGGDGNPASGEDTPKSVPDKGQEGGESGKPRDKEPERGDSDAPQPKDKEGGSSDSRPSERDELDSIDLDAFLDKDSDSFGELSVREWAAVIRGVRDVRSQISELKSQLAEVGEYANERRREELDTRIDAAFDGLGEEFSDIFGRGSARSIDRALVDNRNKVLREAGYLIEGHRRDGDELSLDDAIRKASLMLYGDRVSKRASRKQEFIQRPTGGGADERGDDAALRVIERFMKKD